VIFEKEARVARSSAPSPKLFVKSAFEAFIQALPAATLVAQWGDSTVAKVGGKIFAILNSGATGLSFKCSDLAFAMLPELEGISPAPYLARAKWVLVSPCSAAQRS
jgi:predicted DNA-binding protein (MmcQ/YjbR family)